MIFLKSTALEKIKYGILGLEDCSKRLRNDKEVVMAAVKRGWSLRYASKKAMIKK